MLDKIKKLFPGVYDEYQHIKRKKIKREIEKIKEIPESEYPKMISKAYESSIGRKLDWSNLQTYTEKMQWAKLYDKNPLKTVLADKYLVREWVAKKIGEQYLIPMLGCWESFDEISFDNLPDRFVLKTNHGTGTNLIVKEKSLLNIKRAKKMFDDWMDIDYAFTNNFQMHYSEIPRRIIAEEYLETEIGELQDYKFLCFNGIPRFCWVDIGRFSKHTRTVFDMDWNVQPWTQALYGISEKPIEKPINFEKMEALARILSNGFAHVRVDFYNVNGTIYFGEMTFTNGSGLDPIVPDEYDYELGNMWELPIE